MKISPFWTPWEALLLALEALEHPCEHPQVDTLEALLHHHLHGLAAAKAQRHVSRAPGPSNAFLCLGGVDVMGLSGPMGWSTDGWCNGWITNDGLMV